MSASHSDSISIDRFLISLFDQIDTAVYVLDSSGRFVYVSPAIEKITGHRAGDLTGTPFHEIVFTGDRSVLEGLLVEASALAARRIIWLLDANSAPVKCVVALCRMTSAGQEHAVGIIGKTGIMDRETGEKMRMFTMAVEQSPATVVITDRNGSIEYVNPKFTRLTGYSFNEVLGHNPRILKSGKQTPEYYRNLWDTISSGKEWRGEFHNRKKDGGSYWESASISPIMNSAGEITHYVAVKEDITDRKMAEEALRVSEESLRKSNNEMQRDLGYAQTVVRRLLPVEPPRVDRLGADFRYIPMEAVGGDFFSFNTLHERGLGVFIGDVGGHGVSAALFLSLVRSFTERLNGTRGENPAGYITDLNADMIGWRIILFLTALYGYFDLSGDRARFRFAKGGHTPPVVYRAAEGSAQLLIASGMPVGLSNDAEFPEMALDLGPGDRVYLYTDGIIEARNATRETLDTEGLLEIITRASGKTLSASLDFVISEVNGFRGAGPVEDDIVLIGFEVLK